MSDLELPWAGPAVRQRLRDIQRESRPGTEEDLARVRLAALSAQRHLDDTGLVLHAGTNAAGDAAHDPRLGTRAICGLPGEEGAPGLPLREDLEVLEVLTARAVARTMRAPYADVRPQSGTLANLAVYAALAPVGATIASMPAASGGHFSHHEHGAAGIRGHRVVELPVDAERQDVDADALPGFLARERPRLIVLGGSVQLFPNDVRTVVRHAGEIGARVLFDAAHTAGLIGGGAFPNPLDGGADAVSFSTYKSYGGPAGGAIVARDATVARRTGNAVFPGLTTNYDAGRLRALHAAADALLREGRRYAALCLASARALALAFVAQGLDVMAAARGYTETHQVMLRMPDRDAALAAVRRCAAGGVYVSATTYRDELGAAAAVRLGVQELVRRGLGPAEMPQAARVVGGLIRAEHALVETRDLVDGLRDLMTEPGRLNRSWPLDEPAAVSARA